VRWVSATAIKNTVKRRADGVAAIVAVRLPRANAARGRLGAGSTDLVDWTVGGDDEVLDAGAFKRDGAEGLLVLRDVVLEDVGQGFSLLGAKIDALEVIEANLVGSVLVDGAEDEEEIPEGEAYLDAVGVGVAVLC